MLLLACGQGEASKNTKSSTRSPKTTTQISPGTLEEASPLAPPSTQAPAKVEVDEIEIPAHEEVEHYVLDIESEISYTEGAVATKKELALAKNRALKTKADMSLEDDRELTRHSQPAAKAKKLTAGEINDFAKWKLWEDLKTGEFSSYSKLWQFDPGNRYTIEVGLADGSPVIDAPVSLLNQAGKVLFTSKTDNTGKAELWSAENGQLEALVEYNGQNHKRKLKNKTGKIHHLLIDGKCNNRNVLDISFVVDATGSMGDEIEYLKAEVVDILEQAEGSGKGLKIRSSSVFYRDHGDAYLTKFQPFTENKKELQKFINQQSAGGGGDYPEAVDAALDVALNQLTWSEEAVARILFLVLDAPPHQNEETNKKMKELTLLAAKKGVRIIPITCSGIDKSVEYLMRCLALTTNGTYVFLTNHSGIGNPHIAPSTDAYSPEKLNDLMVRLILQYTANANCEPVQWPKPITPQLPIDTSEQQQPQALQMNCFPVPTYGPLNISVSQKGGTLLIYDMNGKLLMLEKIDDHEKTINLSELNNGLYQLKYILNNTLTTKQIIVNRSIQS